MRTNVKSATTKFSELRRKIVDDATTISKEVREASLPWQRNIEKANDLVQLAEKNSHFVVEIQSKIQDLVSF